MLVMGRTKWLSCCASLLLGSACGKAASPATSATLAAVLSYTGASSSLAFNWEHALLLGLEEANAAGAGEGGPLGLVTYDSTSNLVAGYKASRDAVAGPPEPLAVIGPDNPALLSALVAAANGRQIVTLTPSETFEITDPRLATATHWLRLNPAVTPIATALAQRAYADGHRRVALCHIDDDYGQNYMRAFGAILAQLGGTVQAFSFHADTSLSAQAIQAPFTLKPDAVFLAMPPMLGAALVNNLGLFASNQGYRLDGWYFTPSLESDLFATNKIPELARAAVGASPQLDTSQVTFTTRFSKRWLGELPTNGATFYYDAVVFLALAIEVARHQVGHAPTSSDVLAAIGSPAMNSGTRVPWTSLSQAFDNARAGVSFVYAGVTGPIAFQGTQDRGGVVPSFWHFDAMGVGIVH